MHIIHHVKQVLLELNLLVGRQSVLNTLLRFSKDKKRVTPNAAKAEIPDLLPNLAWKVPQQGAKVTIGLWLRKNLLVCI